MASQVTFEDPLVWHFAMQDEADEAAPGADSQRAVDLLYLRIAGRRSVVLKLDTAYDLLENDAPDIESTRAAALRCEAARQNPVLYVQLKHDCIRASAAAFQPESDVVLFTHQTDAEDLKELSELYGTQLDAVQNVMFEGSSWDGLDACLELLQFFKNVRRIYVWLESYRFAGDFDRVTKEKYRALAREFRARDQVSLQGRHLRVEYIDYKENVHGACGTDA